MVLATIVRKIKAKEKEVRILILGLDNAGKTTILKRFAGEDVFTVSPTFGFEIKTLEYRGYKLNFWDVGGQTTIRAYWKNYYEETDAVIWTVDSADKARIIECKMELHNLLKEERLLGACLLIFANKQDFPNALTVDDIVKYLQLDLIKTHTCYVKACSALTGEGLTEGIDCVVDDVSSRVFV